jgi:antitoxin component YwqK of YwqJK toxin-antitoxin module
MKIIITEEQKNKLFIPRKLFDDDSRYSDWNNKQPMMGNKRINQYDMEGRKQGYWIEYFDYGKLQSKGSYKNGLRDGDWFFYYRGKFWDKDRYKNGEVVKDSSITESKKLFIPRKLDGEDSRWSDWNKTQPIKDGVRINQYDNEGIKQGYWERPYDNYLPEKKLTIKGVFNNGVRDGWWSITYPNGKVYLKSFFKDGKAIY